VVGRYCVLPTGARRGGLGQAGWPPVARLGWCGGRGEEHDLGECYRGVRLKIQVAVAADASDPTGQVRVAGRFGTDPPVRPWVEWITYFWAVHDHTAVFQEEPDGVGIRPEQQARLPGIEVVWQFLGLTEQVIAQPAGLGQDRPQQSSPLTAAQPVDLRMQMADHALTLLGSRVVALGEADEFPYRRREFGQRGGRLAAGL
jgi:hypothetical protein